MKQTKILQLFLGTQTQMDLFLIGRISLLNYLFNNFILLKVELFSTYVKSVCYQQMVSTYRACDKLFGSGGYYVTQDIIYLLEVGMTNATPDWLNVKDYGADSSGTNDSTADIANAIKALPSMGGVIYFPAGTYRTSGAGITVINTNTMPNTPLNNVSIVGDGPNLSIINYTGTSNALTIGVTASPQDVNTEFVNVRDIGFICSCPNPPSNALIYAFNVYQLDISNIRINGGTVLDEQGNPAGSISNYGIFIDSSGTAVTINNVTSHIHSSSVRIERFLIESANDACIQLGTTVWVVQDIFLSNGNINIGSMPATPTTTYYGINLRFVSGVYAKSIDIIAGAVSIAATPASSGTYASNPPTVNSCFFDQVLGGYCSSHAWQLGGLGQLAEIILNACWAAGAQGNGIVISNTAANGILIQNSNIHYNSLNGILISGGVNVNIGNNMIFSNSIAGSAMYNGITVASGVSQFQIIGNTIGFGGFYDISKNQLQGWGVVIDGGGSANNWEVSP